LRSASRQITAMAEYDPSLARMVVALMNAHDLEWARISRILHNDVSQALSAVGLHLDVLRMDLEHIVPEIGARTAAIQDILERAINHVRNLSQELNPAIAERVGFVFAMEKLVGRYRQEYSGRLRFLANLPERLPPATASALYKIADQALSNAVKHSGSSQIEIFVKQGRQGTVLEVKDGGSGFAVDEVKARLPGLGLFLMEYYATQANIRLSIISRPGAGATVRVTCPAPTETKDQPH
jgi:signal transduction histidine kinase